MTMQQSRAGVAGAVGVAGATASARRKGAAGFVVPLVLPVAGLAALLAACSSTSSKGSSTTSPAAHQASMPKPSSSKPAGSPSSPGKATPSGSPSLSAAVCEHVKSLRDSLTSVTHLKYNGSTATVITADLKNITTQLTALKGEPALSTEVSTLTASVTNVENAAKAVTTPPTAAQVKAVITALNNLKATAKPIIGKLKAACP